MKKLLLSSALFLISFIGFSQTKGISYQAVIIDPNPIQIPGSDITAQPYVSKDVWIRFGIYAGSNLQYEELHKTKTDEYGLVNLIIGAGVNTGRAGTFTSLSWDGVTKNIITNVSFDQGGSYTEVSNQKLNYVPYTLLAETAVKLAGVLPIASGGTGATNAIAARTNLGLGNVDNTADADKPVSIATLAILDTKEAIANKSTNIIADSASSVKYPTVKAIKDYIDSRNSLSAQQANQANRANLAAKATALETPRTINGVAFDGTANITIPVGVTPPDANATTKGLVKLAGDLTGTADAPVIAAGAVTDAKITSMAGSKVTGNIAGNAGTATKLAAPKNINGVPFDGSSDITISASAATLSGTVAIANGGTGATTASGARTNLGLVIGTDVLAQRTFGTAANSAAADFVAATEKGANNGVATLGVNGKIPSVQIPSISFQSVSVVNSDATMTAIAGAQVGSIAIRSDQNINYVLSTLPATTLSNWIQLAASTDVSTINGLVGPSVNLTTNEIPEGNTNKYFTDARVRNAISAVAPLNFNTTSGVLSMTAASGSSGGYLSSADFTTFNNKQTALTAGVDYATPSGNITGNAANVTGIVSIANGGTGTSTATGALVALGAEPSENKSNDILVDGSSTTKFPSFKAIKDYVDQQSANAGVADNSITSAKINGNLAVLKGGTGASTAAGARTNLGLVIGTDVMAANATTALTGDVTGSGNGSFATTVNSVGGVSSSTIATLPTNVSANTTSITANTTAIATINTNLALKAPLASPTFTGTPTAPTPTTNDNSTKVATTEYVQANLGTVSAGTLTGTTLATTITGSSLTSVGTITSGVWSATTIDITKGGTGATTAAGARTNLGLGTLATNSTIVDADVDANAAIQDTKLATISTAGKVSNSATTATTASTSNSIVLRDVYGSFAAGEITAAGLNSSGNINVNGIKIGTPGGASNIGISDAAFTWASPVGNGNTVLGNYAFTSSSGSSNTAIGHNSIRQGSGGSGNNNTAVGAASLSSGQAANNNTAIGAETLNSSTGIDNTALGYYSGRGITTGTKNTFLGSNADASANNLENATAIGYGAVVNSSNKIQLGNSNVTAINTSGVLTAAGFVGPLTGNATTATTAGNISATSNSTLTSLANLATVGTITSGVWSATTIDIAKGGTGATTAAAALTNLGAEATANKSIATDLGGVNTSDVLFPTQKAVKAYVDAQTASAGVSDGSITNAKLAGSITSSKLVGTDITTVGTITAGTWSASVIDIAHGGTGSSTVTGAKTNLGLNNVENTALSTWTGSTNITTVGALTAQTKTFMFQDLILGYGANNQAKIQTDASNKYLSFYPNYNVESTRMWPSGNVTIQTGGTFTDNGFKLEVAGTSKFTGNASIVGNLDVTGNITSATWSGTTIGIANGGTGSTTKNFVDLTTTQTIAGAKTFSSDLTTNGIRIGTGRGSGISNYIMGNSNTLMSTTGSNNMAFGDNTGMANTSGLKNLAIGSEAFRYNTTGSENVGIGFSSLRNNLSGSFNTAVGVNANSINTTGSYLTAIGYGADFSSTALTNATAIGNGAIAGASNTIQLGNTSVTSVVTSGTISATGFTGPLTGNASTATALATGRTISVSGDLDFTTGTFDGTTNATASATLTNTSVTAGTYGSSTAIPTFTVDSKGRLTAASTVGITAGVSTLAYSTTGASNGGTISGTTLTLTAADASNPGLISTGAQTIAGAKTFTNTATFNTDISVNGLTVGRGAGAVASNAALGATALNANTSGNYNVGVGSEALKRNTGGSVNVALGAATIDYLTSGNNNTVIGGFAGRNYGPTAAGTVATMNNGILLGYDARPLADAGTDEVVIGMRAIGHGSNTVTLGNSNNTKTYINGDLNITGNITSATWSGTIISSNKGGAGSVNGLLKANGSGVVTAAVAGTDYQAPLTAGTSFIAPNAAITSATKTKITYDAFGLVTAGADATTADIASSTDKRYVTDAQSGVLSNTSGTNTGDQTITLTGDVTGTGTESFAATLTNTAVTAGSYGSSTAIPTFTVDSKGRLTAASTASIIADAGTLSGTTLKSSVVSSSLTSVGTITSGTWSGTVIGNNVGGAGSVNGLLKANGAGVVSVAVAGTDYLNPSTSNIKIGYVSGGGTQGAHSIAIGSNAAQSGTQAEAAVAIGYAAGQNGQGANSVAIGAFAGSSQGANSIALNASGNVLSPSSSGFYVDPVNNASTSSFMFYNTTTKEISYSAIPTLNQNTTGNATTATTAGNITATSNTTLTSLANLATVGTITQGTWSGTTIAVANGGTGTSTSTGSGSLVLNTSPTLVTPNIGAANGTSLSLTGNLSAAAGTFSTTLSAGASTLGATSITGTLGVSGDVAVNTNKFTVAATSGNTVIAGTLGVTGATTLSSTLGVTGATTLASAAITGNETVGGTLGVTGATTLSGTSAHGGASTFSSTVNVTGATTLTSLTTTGAATFSSTVTIPTGAGLNKVLTSDANGGATWKSGYTSISSKTDNYTLTLDDNFIIIGSATATGKTFTLPTAVGCSGKEFTIKNLSAFSVSIATTSSQKIIQDNTTTSSTSATIGIEPSNNWIKLISDGTDWIAFRALF